MNMKPLVLFSAVFLFGLANFGAVRTATAAVIVDSFVTSDMLIGSGTSEVMGPGILGGYRAVTVTKASGGTALYIAGGGASSALFSGSGAFPASLKLAYDGIGSSGFTATDLTEGGTNSFLTFVNFFYSSSINATLDLSVTVLGTVMGMTTPSTVLVSNIPNSSTSLAISTSLFDQTVLQNATSVEFTFSRSVLVLRRPFRSMRSSSRRRNLRRWLLGYYSVRAVLGHSSLVVGCDWRRDRSTAV